MANSLARPVAGPHGEEDFPKGHPGRNDYDPESQEAKDWASQNVHPLGERDFPVGHTAAADTPGNLNHLTWAPGVDPLNPHREAHTGRTPAQVEGLRKLSEAASRQAQESPVTYPVDAAVLNAMLDTRRKDLGRDLLTPEEYQSVVRDYHVQRSSDVEKATEELKLTVRDQAISYVMSRGYSLEVASIITDREGPERVLQQAGIKPR